MIRTAMETDIGLRENLEDTARVVTIKLNPESGLEATIAVLPDGAGGPNAGEVASQLGADHIASEMAFFFIGSDLDGAPLEVKRDRLLAGLDGSMRSANDLILQSVEQKPELSGMATTVVCAVMLGNLLVVGWAGDSRAYVYSKHRFARLTRDHSKVQELLDLGLINANEAKTHPQAHTITQYLGKPKNFAPAYSVCEITPGDIVLLCSDGLTDVLPDETIERVVASCHAGSIRFDELPGQLVRAALKAGTTDNTTVVCAQYEPNPPENSSRKLRRTVTADYAIAVAQSFNHLQGGKN